MFAPSWCCPSQPSPGRWRLISRTLIGLVFQSKVSCGWCSKLHGALLDSLLSDLDGHVHYTMRILTLASLHSTTGTSTILSMHWISGTSTVCSTVRSETGSRGITVTTSVTISDIALQLWCLCDPLDLVYHWHLSSILSCLGGWYLALHHNCDVCSLCAGPVGAPRSVALLNPKRLSTITTGMSVSCACVSTVFRIWMSGTVSASLVRLHELCLRHPNSLRDLLNGRHLSLCHQRIARSSVVWTGVCLCVGTGISMALSMNGTCRASQHCFGHRLSFHNDSSQPRSRPVPVESPDCSVDTCVEDETVDSSGVSAVKNLILFSAWCASSGVCVILTSCVPASSSPARFVDVACCWHCSSCLQFAMHFHPQWVRSSQFFSPAVGPLFPLAVSIAHRVWTSIIHRVVLDLSLCLLASCRGIISVMFSASAGFTQVLVVVSAAAAA